MATHNIANINTVNNNMASNNIVSNNMATPLSYPINHSYNVEIMCFARVNKFNS